MWTAREKIEMEMTALDRVSETLYKKYTELLELQDSRPLTSSELDTLHYLAERVNVVSSEFVRLHNELQKLPKITHDCTLLTLCGGE